MGIESPFFQKKFVRQKLNHCNVDADFNVDADAKMLMPRFSKDRRNLLTSECLLSGSTTPYKYRLLRYFPVPDHQFAENLILYFAFNKKKRRWKYNITNFTGFTISFSDKNVSQIASEIFCTLLTYLVFETYNRNQNNLQSAHNKFTLTLCMH